MSRRLALTALTLLLAAACALAGEPPSGPLRFTEPPTAVRDGAGLKIAFRLDRETDVQVDLIDGGGHVVRHLAAGLLGPNAPAPLTKNSVAQTLIWNGKDDGGKAVLNSSPAPAFTVRVRAGIGAKLDRFIGSPADVAGPPVTGLGVGPDGTLYVLSNRDKAGGVFLFALDSRGKYLRTLLPAPAGLPNDKLKGLERITLNGGAVVPIVYQPYTADTAPFLSGIRSQPLMVTADGRILFCSGGNNWTDQDNPRHLLAITTDGGTPPDMGFVGPELGPHGRYSSGLPQQQAVVASDGKTIYFVGMGVLGPKGKPAKGLHAVGRMTWDSKAPTPFIGDPDNPGDDGTHLNTPVSIALDANGNLCVADQGNNRVAVFDSAGKFLGQTEVDRPGQVIVAADGALYVLTEPKGTRWEPLAVVKYDKAVGGREVARYAFNGRSAVMALDPSTKPTRLWLSYDSGWGKPSPLTPIADGGDKLTAGPDVLGGRPAPFKGPMFIASDAARGRLYVADFSQAVLRVDLDGDKVSPFLKVSEAATDRDGNLYVLPGYNTDTLERLTPDGKPLPFAATGSSKLKIKYRAGLPNVGVRGLTVGADGAIYAFQDNNAGTPMDLWKFTADGKVASEKLIAGIPPDSANGVAVDRDGNIYIGVNVQDPAHLYPDAFEGVIPRLAWFTVYTTKSSWYAVGPMRGLPDAPWNRAYMNFYLYHSGWVMKFAPGGGRFFTGPGSARLDAPRPPDVPADAAAYRTAYMARPVWCQGALWRYRGFALAANRTESWGDPACSCMTSRFAIDDAGLLFVPDAFQFSLGILDRNGNLLARFGQYGNPDDRPADGIPMGFPNAVTVIADKAYVVDRKNRRIVVAQLTWAAQAACEVK
ncbi:MAG: hypothetical protein BIFFINMI_01287 [Phycisphaerae bacterium]|nr:hypothetical protein [Phycisphaerae bacterium]